MVSNNRDQSSENHDDLDLQLSLGLPSAAADATTTADAATLAAADTTTTADAATTTADAAAATAVSQENSLTSSAASQENALTSLRITENLGTRRSSLRRSNSRSPKMMGPIEPPYPWSTNQIARVHTLDYLRSNQILTITGDVRCRRCQENYEIEYDIISKFNEIASFVENNMLSFRDRAPTWWMIPDYLTCRFCGYENGVRPVIPNEWRRINWLFLLLGEMVGALNLNHLKYFCTYTNNHRTGAKDRLLYLTYITLCHQVDPSGRFSRI